MCECDSLRLIGRKHQCPRCCAWLLPGEKHKNQAACDKNMEEWLEHSGLKAALDSLHDAC